MLFVVCSLFVGRLLCLVCVLFDGSFVGRWLLRVVWLLTVGWCSLFVMCCLCVVRCLLFVVCFALCVVCRLLFAV